MSRAVLGRTAGMAQAVSAALGLARRVAAFILALLCPLVAGPALGCTVTTSLATTLGTYSPAAVGAGAAPAMQSQAGLTCSTALLTLLASNYLRAKVTSQNGMTLVQSGGSSTIAYVASADPNGTYKFAQGGTVDYMQNNLLNVLGLLGGSSAVLPVYVRPVAGATPPAGTYTDRLTIDWSWYQCPGIGALGACVGTVDSGSGRTTLDVTLVVSPRNVVLTVATAATWDPVDGAAAPKEVPGGKLRATIGASNPDIVGLDSGSLAIIVPVSGRLIAALDGDGSASTSVVQFADGSPASGMSLTYAGPSSTTDDVDFSSDGGVTWAYAPVAGDLASEGAVTHIRFRPRGGMPAQSAFSVSLPFLIR